jgi:hypothetical protein
MIMNEADYIQKLEYYEKEYHEVLKRDDIYEPPIPWLKEGEVYFNGAAYVVNK